MDDCRGAGIFVRGGVHPNDYKCACSFLTALQTVTACHISEGRAKP